MICLKKTPEILMLLAKAAIESSSATPPQEKKKHNNNQVSTIHLEKLAWLEKNHWPDLKIWLNYTTSLTWRSSCTIRAFGDDSPSWIIAIITNRQQIRSKYPGWWFEPLWKIWKSIGLIRNPIYGKINLMFQTTNQHKSRLQMIN